MRSILKFLVYSNIYVALPVTALAATGLLLLDALDHFYYLIWIYFLTFFTYNFHRFIGLKIATRSPSEGRMGWSAKHPVLLKTMLGIGLAGSLIVSIMLKLWVHWYLFLPVILVTALYALPVIPMFNGQRIRLREMPVVKFLWIGLTVSYLTTVVMAELVKIGSTGYIGFMFLHQTLMISALTVPFDIRDVAVDKMDKVMTLPRAIGIKSAKLVATVLVVFAMVMALQFESTYRPGLLVTDALAILAIAQSGRNKSELWFAFVVEGVLLIQPLIIWSMTKL